MTRPAEHTRDAIIKAAVHLFAEKGFDGTSVRDIVTKARVNQAAINYHFKSKDGLYLEVLKTAFEKLTTDAGFDPEKLKTFSREQALRSFLRQQLRPLLQLLKKGKHPEQGRHDENGSISILDVGRMDNSVKQQA